MNDEVYLFSCQLRKSDRDDASSPGETAKQDTTGNFVCAVADSGNPPSVSVYADSASRIVRGRLGNPDIL